VRNCASGSIVKQYQMPRMNFETGHSISTLFLSFF